MREFLQDKMKAVAAIRATDELNELRAKGSFVSSAEWIKTIKDVENVLKAPLPFNLDSEKIDKLSIFYQLRKLEKLYPDQFLTHLETNNISSNSSLEQLSKAISSFAKDRYNEVALQFPTKNPKDGSSLEEFMDKKFANRNSVTSLEVVTTMHEFLAKKIGAILRENQQYYDSEFRDKNMSALELSLKIQQYEQDHNKRICL